MYERYTVGEDPNTTPTTTASLVTTPYSYDSTISAENIYILFVHGWNLPTWEKDAFAQTAFKRLYWQGFKGHFGEFRWPTGSGFTGIISGLIDSDNYDNSESNAWASATGLLGLLNNLNSQYPDHVYLMAHSMGNVVASEALKQAGANQVVNTYVAMQAAIPADCYDASTSVVGDAIPDFYANFWTSGDPCYFNATAGAGSYINFYNESDWALGYWQDDQGLKPDSGYGYNFSTQQFYKGLGINLYFPNNTYEIFSHADPASSLALGAQADVGGVFSGNQLDLNALPYIYGNLHKGHSAEFNSDNMQRATFWKALLTQMGL